MMPICPRCRLELQNESYEGHEVLFCGSCWGHWMTADAFTQILKSEEYTFGDEEKASVLRGWAGKSDENVNLEAVVTCPICNKATERKAFSEDCTVVLDVCHDHGVWLDSSEIKQVQVYFDSLK